MIRESGQVVDVEGDYAWIESERRSTCGGCSARKGCGTGAIAKVLGRKRLNLRAINRANARIGDHVVIGIAESGVVRGSLAVYAVPLAGLFAGAVTGHVAGGLLSMTVSDLPAIAGAVTGLAAALVWLRRFSRLAVKDEKYQPVVLSRETRLPTA